MEWSKGDIGVIVSEIAGRKKPVLFLRRGEKMAKVGAFNSADDANMFQMFMDLLMNGNR